MTIYIPSCYAGNHKYEKNWLIFDRIKPLRLASNDPMIYERGRFSAYKVTNPDGSFFAMHLHLVDGEYSIECYANAHATYYSFDEVKDFLLHHEIITESENKVNDLLLLNLVDDKADWAKKQNNEWFAKFPGENRKLTMLSHQSTVDKVRFEIQDDGPEVEEQNLNSQNLSIVAVGEYFAHIRYMRDDVYIYSVRNKQWEYILPSREVRNKILSEREVWETTQKPTPQGKIFFDLNATVKLWR